MYLISTLFVCIRPRNTQRRVRQLHDAMSQKFSRCSTGNRICNGGRECTMSRDSKRWIQKKVIFRANNRHSSTDAYLGETFLTLPVSHDKIFEKESVRAFDCLTIALTEKIRRCDNACDDNSLTRRIACGLRLNWRNPQTISDVFFWVCSFEYLWKSPECNLAATRSLVKASTILISRDVHVSQQQQPLLHPISNVSIVDRFVDATRCRSLRSSPCIWFRQNDGQ